MGKNEEISTICASMEENTTWMAVLPYEELKMTTEESEELRIQAKRIIEILNDYD